MYVYFDSVTHYTCYVNKVAQIKLIQIQYTQNLGQHLKVS